MLSSLAPFAATVASVLASMLVVFYTVSNDFFLPSFLRFQRFRGRIAAVIAWIFSITTSITLIAFVFLRLLSNPKHLAESIHSIWQRVGDAGYQDSAASPLFNLVSFLLVTMTAAALFIICDRLWLYTRYRKIFVRVCPSLNKAISHGRLDRAAHLAVLCNSPHLAKIVVDSAEDIDRRHEKHVPTEMSRERKSYYSKALSLSTKRIQLGISILSKIAMLAPIAGVAMAASTIVGNQALNTLLWHRPSIDFLVFSVIIFLGTFVAAISASAFSYILKHVSSLDMEIPTAVRSTHERLSSPE